MKKKNSNQRFWRKKEDSAQKKKKRRKKGGNKRTLPFLFFFFLCRSKVYFFFIPLTFRPQFCRERSSFFFDPSELSAFFIFVFSSHLDWFLFSLLCNIPFYPCFVFFFLKSVKKEGKKGLCSNGTNLPETLRCLLQQYWDEGKEIRTAPFYYYCF